MKTKSFYSLCALISALLLTSCGQNASTPSVSLKNDVDSVSYAYGVNSASQGFFQYLEQQGIIESSSSIDYEYATKISQEKDSVKIAALEAEKAEKIKSIDKLNEAKINEFIKGAKAGINGGKNQSAYIAGLTFGQQITDPRFDQAIFQNDSNKHVKKEHFLAGFFSVITKKKTLIAEEDASKILNDFVTKAREKAQEELAEKLKEQYTDSIAVAENFLKENKTRQGVVTLPSGLQYEVLHKGSGVIPTDSNMVKVHYHGTLINGTVFDSSIARKEPVEFPVNGVIKGWTEALKLMPKGSKWKLYIPYDLAYGAENKGTIPPFSTLIFEVELLDVK